MNLHRKSAVYKFEKHFRAVKKRSALVFRGVKSRAVRQLKSLNSITCSSWCKRLWSRGVRAIFAFASPVNTHRSSPRLDGGRDSIRIDCDAFTNPQNDWLITAMAILDSTVTCPQCGHQATEQMPTDACQFFYDCKGCGARLKPKPGDCCVFCSYGSVPCPPVQAGKCCR